MRSSLLLLVCLISCSLAVPLIGIQQTPLTACPTSFVYRLFYQPETPSEQVRAVTVSSAVTGSMYLYRFAPGPTAIPQPYVDSEQTAACTTFVTMGLLSVPASAGDCTSVAPAFYLNSSGVGGSWYCSDPTLAQVTGSASGGQVWLGQVTLPSASSAARLALRVYSSGGGVCAAQVLVGNGPAPPSLPQDTATPCRTEAVTESTTSTSTSTSTSSTSTTVTSTTVTVTVASTSPATTAATEAASSAAPTTTAAGPATETTVGSSGSATTGAGSSTAAQSSLGWVAGAVLGSLAGLALLALLALLLVRRCRGRRRVTHIGFDAAPASADARHMSLESVSSGPSAVGAASSGSARGAQPLRDDYDEFKIDDFF